MAPGREDLLVELGSGFTQTFTYQDPSGSPVDLTLWDATLVMKHFADSEDILFQTSKGSGITLGADGTITISIAAGQTLSIQLPFCMDYGPFPGKGTSRIPAGAYNGGLGVWELKLFPPSGQPFALLFGIVCFVIGASSSVLTT